ncbi:hydrolase TatD [Candidatus Epulonipiscium fishelsonii]|uniref:Hydrolase TatD n=1 Tax=Candidatus Epulonipiscium fishelsonii TaxID=77094 RepID=A0ACC8XEQ6_9FIRM|nr:hydrolase TatD [Epulopiscium sp. SCG-B05WGA-EpuloA1]ONI41521.1 hydrolase TatD [Epulopiscium sp. SCG-B11WGA-EpuloA1]
MTKIFDSHAHYNDDRFNEDREILLQDLHNNGVELIMNVGADMKESAECVKLAEKYDYIYASVGVHPHYVENMTDKDIVTLEKLAQNKQVKAIGEIGLDYHYDNSPRDLQQKWFKAQLALAKKVNLPVIIHSREASQETFDILKESTIRDGVIHCFSGSSELAKEYVKMGFYIGIGGTLTFKNARKTVEVVEEIPLDKIVIETDCPYLSPMPHRGERNHSLYLTYVIDKIAEIKNMDKITVGDITFENAKQLYRL